MTITSDPPVSVSKMLGLQSCNTTTGLVALRIRSGALWIRAHHGAAFLDFGHHYGKAHTQVPQHSLSVGWDERGHLSHPSPGEISLPSSSHCSGVSWGLLDNQDSGLFLVLVRSTPEPESPPFSAAMGNSPTWQPLETEWESPGFYFHLEVTS